MTSLNSKQRMDVFLVWEYPFLVSAILKMYWRIKSKPKAYFALNETPSSWALTPDQRQGILEDYFLVKGDVKLDKRDARKVEAEKVLIYYYRNYLTI